MPTSANTRLQYLGKPGEQSKRDIWMLLAMQVDTFGEVVEDIDYIPTSHWWFMLYKGETSGYCALHQYDNRPETCFLALAGVLEKFRGRGLQKKMIRHRVRFARKLGAERVITYVSPDNLPSANSLAACGFKLYRPKWDWGVEGALYYRRTL